MDEIDRLKNKLKNIESHSNRLIYLLAVVRHSDRISAPRHSFGGSNKRCQLKSVTTYWRPYISKNVINSCDMHEGATGCKRLDKQIQSVTKNNKKMHTTWMEGPVAVTGTEGEGTSAAPR